MKSYFYRFGPWVFLGLVGMMVVLNLVEIAHISSSQLHRSAPADVLGYGLLPIWLPLAMAFSVFIFVGRAYNGRNRIAALSLTFIGIFVIDWMGNLRALDLMGIR